LKEKKLAKHFIDAYSVDRKSRDAVHLLNWKKPTEKSVSYTQQSDFTYI